MADINKLADSEIWIGAKGIEDYYEVSSLGRIRRKGGNRSLKCRYNKDGYLLVNLSAGGVRYTKQVHRLVALSFLHNPNNYPCVNHKNEIKADNRTVNLEWCTVEYNNNYGNRNNNFKKRVAKIGLSGRLICVYSSVLSASKSTGVSVGAISNVSNGKSKTAGGYHWLYV